MFKMRMIVAALIATAFVALMHIDVPRAEESGASSSPDERSSTTEAESSTSSDAGANRGSSGMLHLDEVVVEAARPLSAASSDEIRAKDYELRPHRTAQQILNNVPGLVVAQHQGGGKATQYLIRGFDADHGTDFAVFVDDLPVNLPTHAHGQGYADLNFLIPETVDRLQLYKGPYFAQLGDFATAGALNIVTKEEFPENFVLAEGGSFATQRYVFGVSPRLGNVKTLFAGQAYFTDGPFDDPENYGRYNLYSKFTLDPTPDSKLSVAADLYAGKWHGSGQIPLREVHAGHLDRFGSLDPTEGGKSDRQNVNLHYTYTPYLDDRPAIEDRSLTARGYTLVDLIGKYRWRNVEASVSILNITNTDWREAQFADTTCTRAEIGVVPGCSAKPGKQSAHAEDPPADIHFTPGSPITVIGGIKVYF